MVSTRSGRNTTKTTTRSTTRTKTNKTRSKQSIRENITMNIMSRSKTVSFENERDFIYRTVNIRDMTDFVKIEKYRTQYSNCLYILTSSDKDKIVYDYCSLEQLRENVCEYLMYNNDVISTIDCKLYVILTNNSYMILDKMIEIMNEGIRNYEIVMYRNRYQENYIMTDSEFLQEVIDWRDYAVNKFTEY